MDFGTTSIDYNTVNSNQTIVALSSPESTSTESTRGKPTKAKKPNPPKWKWTIGDDLDGELYGKVNGFEPGPNALLDGVDEADPVALFELFL